MDDDDARIALTAGTEDQKARAKDDLAARYIPPLVTFLSQKLHVPESIAISGAADAVMELFSKLESDPDSISPEDDGFWRWLMVAGTFRARDHRRWIRRHAAVGTADEDVLAGAAADGDDDLGGPPEPPDVGTPRPPVRAASREAASRVLAAILRLPSPGRNILLFDFAGAYEELTGDELDAHDQELIDVTKAYGIWTTDALRSARTRARKQLRDILDRELR